MSTPAIVSKETVFEIRSAFVEAVYLYGLVDPLCTNCAFEIDVSTNEDGVRVCCMAYVVPRRHTILLMPQLAMVRNFSPQFHRNLPFVFDLRDIRLASSFRGQSHHSQWVVFIFNMYPIVRTSDVTNTPPTREEMGRVFVTEQARVTRLFRDSVYHTAGVESLAKRASVPRPVGKRALRPWDPRRLFSLCGRLFRRKAKPVAAEEENLWMSVDRFLDESMAEVDDNLIGAIGSTVASPMQVIRPATLAMIADTCVLLDAVLERRNGTTGLQNKCTVWSPNSSRPCVQFRVPHSPSLSDIYVHVLRNLHDSLSSVEITPDRKSGSDMDVWVFLQTACQVSVTSEEARKAEPALSSRVLISDDPSPQQEFPMPRAFVQYVCGRKPSRLATVNYPSDIDDVPEELAASVAEAAYEPSHSEEDLLAMSSNAYPGPSDSSEPRPGVPMPTMPAFSEIGLP